MPAPPEIAAHKPHWHRGLAWKSPVRVVATANGTIGTAYQAGASVDGVTLVEDDRILLTAQTGGTANGIYVVEGTATGTPTRAFDFDDSAEIVGATVYVTEGATYGGTYWRCTTTGTPVIDESPLTWDQMVAGGTGDVATDSIWDAKGDIAIGTAANAAAVLSVGGDGAYLMASASATTGVKWQLNNFGASAAPTATDDAADGYGVGSIWVNTSADTPYICVDATTGSAVWSPFEGTATPGGGCVSHASGAMIAGIYYSKVGVGPMMLAAGYEMPAGGGTWPTANKAILYPFVLAEDATITSIGWANSTVGTAIIEAGVYDDTGALLVSTGTVTQGTAGAIQEIDVTDTALTAGATYYLAMVASSTDSWFKRDTPNSRWISGWGVREKTSAFPLPSTLTGTSAVTSNYANLVFARITSSTGTGADHVATMPYFLPAIHSTHGLIGIGATSLGGNWPSANLAIYVPFWVNSDTVVSRLWWSGSNTTGNVDVGIFAEDGTKLTSTGATANANALNVVDVANVTLTSGRYYIGMSCSTTSGIYRDLPGLFAVLEQGVKQEASAHALPGTATYSDIGYDYIPCCGFSTTGSDL